MPLILNNVKRGSLVVSDSWKGYSSKIMRENGLQHEFHNHEMNDFGESGSIEALWNKLKKEIKSHYSHIPSGNTEDFLYECYFFMKCRL
jgi:hypothetical protein